MAVYAQSDFDSSGDPIEKPTPPPIPTPVPNIAPTVNNWSYETTVGTPVSTLIDASDVNNDRLTFSVLNAPQHGSLKGTAPDLTYTPEANFTGTDTFTFKANDGEFDSPSGTVTINVIPTDKNTPLGVDAQIRESSGTDFIGNGIYNRSGKDQTLQRAFKANTSASYEVKLQNEEETTRPLLVHSIYRDNGWSVRYFDAPTKGNDITAQVTGEGWTTPNIVASGEITMRVEITPTLNATEAQEVAIILSDQEMEGVDTVKMRGQYVLPYLPDATIEVTQIPVWESYDLGDDIYLPNGDNPKLPLYDSYFEAQTIRQHVGSGQTATYRIFAQNDGDSPDQLRLKAPASSNGWVVRYFNEYGNGEEITAEITGAGWQTPQLQTKADWGIRVEVTPGENTIGSTLPIAVQVDSVGAGFLSELRDIVTAITTCEHVTNDLVLYLVDDYGRANTRGLGNRIFNADALNQTLSRSTYVLNPISFLISSRVSHAGALYKYTAPAGNDNWSVRYYYLGKEITKEITGAGWEHQVSDRTISGAYPNLTIYDPIRVVVTPLTTVANAADINLLIQATAVHEAASVDAVKISVHREPTLDVSIRTDYETDYQGVGIFNTDARNQTVGYSQLKSKAKGVTAVFDIRIANHGISAESYVVKAPARVEGWKLNYFDAQQKGSDITVALNSETGWTTPKLAIGETTNIRLEVNPEAFQGNPVGGSQITTTAVTEKTVTDTVKATFGAQRIQKLQYSLDQGTNWIDAPDAISGKVILAGAKQMIGFRAVAIDPTLPWPIVPDVKPLWDDGGYWNMGEEIWIQTGAAGKDRLVSAECGNILKTKVKVYETYKVSLVGSKTYVALNGGKEGQLTLTSKVTKSDGKPAPGMTVRFTANYLEGGEVAGEIEGPGLADDQAVTDANGVATVTLFTGNREGYVDLRAYRVEGGRDVEASRKQACVFGLPTVETPEGLPE